MFLFSTLELVCSSSCAFIAFKDPEKGRVDAVNVVNEHKVCDIVFLYCLTAFRYAGWDECPCITKGTCIVFIPHLCSEVDLAHVQQC